VGEVLFNKRFYLIFREVNGSGRIGERVFEFEGVCNWTGGCVGLSV